MALLRELLLELNMQGDAIMPRGVVLAPPPPPRAAAQSVIRDGAVLLPHQMRDA